MIISFIALIAILATNCFWMTFIAIYNGYQKFRIAKRESIIKDQQDLIRLYEQEVKEMDDHLAELRSYLRPQYKLGSLEDESRRGSSGRSILS